MLHLFKEDRIVRDLKKRSFLPVAQNAYTYSRILPEGRHIQSALDVLFGYALIKESCLYCGVFFACCVDTGAT